MKKKVLTRKLIMSIATAAMTAACLGTTTYAWFSRNDVVWTEDTDFNLDFYDGLLVSFDGVDFHDNVNSTELAKAITKLDNDTDAENAFKEIRLDGVTPKHDANGLVEYDTDDNVVFTYDTVDTETKTHSSAIATANKKYISFDLYFRIADGGTVTSTSAPKYKLVMTDNTYLRSKSGVQNVTLANSLNTMDGTLKAGQTIEVDGANALRAGFKTENGLYVYEPVTQYNLGSAAIQDATDPYHDPSKNAMYTYYNNFFSEKFTSAAPSYGDDGNGNVKFGEAFNTKAQFADGTSLGTFEAVVADDGNGNQIYKYADVKVTLYVWLEGWDADYFYGISSSNELARTMQSRFEFTYEKI